MKTPKTETDQFSQRNIIVGDMGITCGYAYVLSRSIWVPVIIHWVTVTVWVLFLGGRNLVLEL
ncbi:CPBP family glutamic-type intramembrane protease [uncultured Marinobacter sp.]|uniref:CPBP family glutamic-type intramembrane protease n=1 Tax=uncultured Marinobacter sp. TaxID=187379 RepID=UPI00344FBF2F